MALYVDFVYQAGELYANESMCPKREKKMSVKKRSLLLGCILLAMLLGGCGKAKGAGGLVSQAQKEHGPCTVVSETQGSDGGWEVVLYDELQGFEYKVSSYMDDFSLDGSSFGSFPGQYDSFKQCLLEHVCTLHRQEMDDISAAYAVNYDLGLYPDIVINAPTLADGRLAAAELARTLQTDMTPVRFFYFRASNGKEYYLCDFTYYDESFSDYSWYTNYDSIK